MELPRMFLSDKERTFQHDESLPSAPIPSLNHTLAKYLDSVRPHLTDDEYHQTEFIVQQFGSGIGKELHGKLVERHTHARNWLEQYWQDKGYLELRMPAAPLINITGPGPYFHTFWPPKDGTQVERAALTVWTVLVYWDMLRKEKIVVDRGGRTTVWDMTQYRRMFNTCKVPGINKDQILTYFKPEREGSCPTHMTAICKGRIFKFEAVHPNGEIFTAPEVQVQLQHIRDVCDRLPAIPGLGALTSENRTTWAKLHEHLISIHPDHEQYLEVLQSSLFTVILDDTSPAPADYNNVAYHGLCGNPELRWFDKSVCMAVFKNGTVASNLDHSPYEGIVYILATYFCYLILEKTGGKWVGSTEIRDSPKPVELAFHIDQHIQQAIETAKINYWKLANNLEVTVPTYRGFGKDLMKKYKLHPDAFVQVALQLAYYRLYKKPAPAYETGSIRKFYHGRTETVRSCTVEAIEWCKAMLDPEVSGITRCHLLLAAIKKHLTLMGEAMDLKGCDRHLFGLSLIAQEEGIETPLIYKDKGFTKSGGGGNFVLSTSFIGYYKSDAIMHGGCAPMCENGYGVFYTINPDKISFFLSSWVSHADTHSTKLFASLTQTLDDMKNLLEKNVPITNKL